MLRVLTQAFTRASVRWPVAEAGGVEGGVVVDEGRRGGSAWRPRRRRALDEGGMGGIKVESDEKLSVLWKMKLVFKTLT